MDSSRFPFRFRIGPTTQQGGTQTIQQSIYISHDNPCGITRMLDNKDVVMVE